MVPRLPIGAWLAQIEGLQSDQAVLRVTGNPTPLLRPLPGQDCLRVVQTAASIVDGLLDQLPNPARDVGPLGNSGALPAALSRLAWRGHPARPHRVGALVRARDAVRAGVTRLVGSVDVGLPASIPLVTEDQAPEAVGSYQAIPIDLELGAGWGPRLGPGRLSLDGSVGVAIAIVCVRAPTPGQQVPAQFFLAPGVGYTFELPAHFLVGIRLEERWAQAQSRVALPLNEGIPGNEVVTRVWTFTSTAIVGYRFF